MKFAFAVFLILLPFLGMTQEGAEMPAAEVDHVSEDEKVIEELDAAREQRQKTLESLQNAGDLPPDAGPTLNPEEQLKKLGYNGPMDPTALFNDQALNAMEKIIDQAKLWEVPEEDVRQMILRSFEGKPLGSYVKSSPNLQKFLVDFMRDKKALKSGIAIAKDHDRLKTYLYFWIGIMFAAYYLKRVFVSKYWKKPVKIFASVMFSLVITTITVSTFCIIFSEEMKPIIALAKKHL